MKSGRKESFFRAFIHLYILRPILHLLFGVNITGRENFEGLENFIIASNHNSHLDILLVFSSMPREQINKTHAVAAEEYFSKSKLVFKLISFLFNPVWVNRDDPEMRSRTMNEMRECLANGDNILIFPEGTRGEAGEIQTFKSGVGKLAEEFKNIPIIPVYLFGPERALPKKSFIPVPVWNEILIGPPQLYSGDFQEITSSLETLIKDLSKNEFVLKHKRIDKTQMPPNVLAFLGIDGSGKSTISRKTAEYLSKDSTVALISDKLVFYENGCQKNIQPLLTEKIRTKIGEYAKRAKSLKHYKIPKLAELFLRDHLLVEVVKWYRPDYIVLDGSPLLNLTAWSIIYKEEHFNVDFCEKAIQILTSEDENISANDSIYSDFPELKTLKKFNLNHLKIPDLVMFLDTPVETAVERIENRGEEKQVHENFEKLNKLRKAYNMTIGVTGSNMNIPSKVIDGSGTIEEIVDISVNFINNSGAKIVR